MGTSLQRAASSTPDLYSTRMQHLGLQVHVVDGMDVAAVKKLQVQHAAEALPRSGKGPYVLRSDRPTDIEGTLCQTQQGIRTREEVNKM